MVFASFNAQPDSVPNPDRVDSVAGLSYDYPFVNHYALRWGVTDEQAAANLIAAITAARAFFAPDCPVIPMEQAAGVLTFSAGDCRPIEGFLQTQHDLWHAGGMNPVSAVGLYAWLGNPENDTLGTNAALLAEASRMS